MGCLVGVNLPRFSVLFCFPHKNDEYITVHGLHWGKGKAHYKPIIALLTVMGASPSLWSCMTPSMLHSTASFYCFIEHLRSGPSSFGSLECMQASIGKKAIETKACGSFGFVHTLVYERSHVEHERNIRCPP